MRTFADVQKRRFAWLVDQGGFNRCADVQKRRQFPTFLLDDESARAWPARTLGVICGRRVHDFFEKLRKDTDGKLRLSRDFS
jgi:hypothetical protein